MSGMTPEDRQLLDMARCGHEPSDVDRKRVRAAVLGSLGVGAGLGVTTATSAAGASLVAKTLATVAVVTAVAGGGWVAARAVRPAVVASSSRVDTIASAFAPGKTPRVVASDGEGSSSAIAAPPVPASPPVVTAHSRAVSTPRAVAAPPVHEAGEVTQTSSSARPGQDAIVPAPASTLEGETRLVADGVAALHAGDPMRALALFDDHARAYPDGVLAEERSGERVLALCGAGRTAEAQAAAVQFLRAWPRSPLAARVRASCASAPNP